MLRFIEYSILFIVVAFLQIFLFNNLHVGYFMNPFIYLAFIILLPVDLSDYKLLLLGLFTGVMMDVFMGTPGINVMATVFVAFLRPALIRLFLLKDEVDEGGVPNLHKLGIVKFLNYSFLMVFLHCTTFFMLESMSFAGFGYTLLKILVNTASTLIAVYFIQLIFLFKRSKAL
ncbi:MAG: rod shape-determining protein MreD [Rikenellaceae bacterium]|nr:rod shape-determining protein MreD [Rikenellaceae bacterium]